MSADLDSRVTNGDGRPVKTRQADSGGGGWWFKVRRAPGPDGVELVIAIPGFEWPVMRFAAQADADAAARVAYDEYRAGIASALSR